MLKGINPRITPEMLYVMAQMGHGDDLAIVDANFPAYALARHLPHDRVMHFASRLPGAVQTVLTLLPLDRFVPAAATTMQGVGDPEAVPARWPRSSRSSSRRVRACNRSNASISTR